MTRESGFGRVRPATHLRVEALSPFSHFDLKEERTPTLLRGLVPTSPLLLFVEGGIGNDRQPNQGLLLHNSNDYGLKAIAQA
jgi:hypothetical protein